MKPAVLRCPLCRQLKKRTNPANSRYWLLLHVISEGVKPEGVQHSAEVWHHYFKQRFLGVEEFMLPNKKLIQIPKSSAELDNAEFADYVMKVEQFGMTHNVYMDELEPT